VAPEETGEDSYLASLSDLMVGMLFIFIILLMAFAINYRVAQNDGETQRKELKEKSAQLQATQQQAEREKKLAEMDRENALTELQKLHAEQQRLVNQLNQRTNELKGVTQTLTGNNERRREMLQQLAKRLQQAGVDAILDIQNGELRLPESLLFDSGKADLRDVGVQKVGRLAEVLYPALIEFMQPTNGARLEAVLIEGHTDNVPIRSAQFRDNWELSMERAVNTYRAMTAKSPQLDNLRNGNAQPLFAISGYGDTRPVALNTSDTGRAANRRIALRFLLSSPNQREVMEAERRLREAAPQPR
jgi:flagellar motor protein MotB